MQLWEATVKCLVLHRNVTTGLVTCGQRKREDLPCLQIEQCRQTAAPIRARLVLMVNRILKTSTDTKWHATHSCLMKIVHFILFFWFFPFWSMVVTSLSPWLISSVSFLFRVLSVLKSKLSRVLVLSLGWFIFFNIYIHIHTNLLTCSKNLNRAGME